MGVADFFNEMFFRLFENDGDIDITSQEFPITKIERISVPDIFYLRMAHFHNRFVKEVERIID
jgi:hypothetical protein